MMKNIIKALKRNRLVMDNRAQLGLLVGLPIIGQLLTWGIVALLIYWILNNLITIAIGITLIAIPIVTIFVVSVWAKGRLGDKKKMGATA